MPKSVPSSSVRRDLDSITRVFTGEDGGVWYATMLPRFDQLQTQANEGDAAAARILQVVTEFRHLIEFMSTP